MIDPISLSAFVDELESIELEKEAFVRSLGIATGKAIGNAAGRVGTALAGTRVGHAADRVAVFGRGQAAEGLMARRASQQAAAAKAANKERLKGMRPHQRVAEQEAAARAPRVNKAKNQASTQQAAKPSFYERHKKKLLAGGALGVGGLGVGAGMMMNGGASPAPAVQAQQSQA